MDHTRLLNDLRSPDLLREALNLTISDRRKDGSYYDFFDLEWADRNRDRLIEELADELRDPGSYQPRAGQAYYPPKTELVYRRMVYLTAKDTALRYAFALLCSRYMEPELGDTCFANRRATGARAELHLLVDYAQDSWPKFCEWQAEMAEAHAVLLKTDISAFYDSISHEYLCQDLARLLGVPGDCALLDLFRRVLRTPVVSYSERTGECDPPWVPHQGLLIGTPSEGVFANLYLIQVDEALRATGVAYGRYNDDIRIFGDEREAVLSAVLVLQQQLLRRGLNLNGSKTEIAEGRPGIDDLRSRPMDPSGLDDEEVEEARGEEFADLDEVIDRDFEDSVVAFEEDTDVNDKNAKDFCKYLRTSAGFESRRAAHRARESWHVDRLFDILTRWRSATKAASWRIVEMAAFSSYPDHVREHAAARIAEALESDLTSRYARLRMAMHLLKPRERGNEGEVYRYTETLDGDLGQILRDQVPTLLRDASISMNLLGLEILRSQDVELAEARATVSAHRGDRIPDHLRNALDLF